MKKKIIIKSSFELIAIIVGITLSLWVNEYQNFRSQSKHNIKTLKSIKSEISKRKKYIENKVEQYERDIKIGNFTNSNRISLSIDSLLSMTNSGRSLILTLKAYRAINLPISVYNSLSSDGSIGKLRDDSIKIKIDDIYEVTPSHIDDEIQNEQYLYHHFNEFIIHNYPELIKDQNSKYPQKILSLFFKDKVVLGFIDEKNHIRKFILRLLKSYLNKIIETDLAIEKIIISYNI